MMTFMSHGTQDMYPTFLQQQRHYAPSDIASLTMITNVGAIFGGLAFGYYSDRMGRRRAMITSALFGMLTVPLWVAAPNTALIAVGGFLIQFFVQGCWGVIPAHINELSPATVPRLLPGPRVSARRRAVRQHSGTRVGARRAFQLRSGDGLASPRSS